MANSTSYSYDDMMRMQQDAIRRVKEMQRKGQQNVRGKAFKENSQSQNAQEKAHTEQKSNDEKGENDETSAFLKGILNRFGLDYEKVMLLMILLLLLNDGADKKLILSIVYLLL